MPPIRALDLDGTDHLPLVDGIQRIPAPDWGPSIRLACSFGRFDRFRRWLSGALPDGPGITLFGSGDFHHISLALLERIQGPFNLLVLDKHPDWMRSVPFLHCGTWLRHALRLPNLLRVFHCGGETDFDNLYRPLAPWPEIESGRVVVFPAARRFSVGRWSRISTHPLLEAGSSPSSILRGALRPYLDDLRRVPLYVSFDKDVLTSSDASVNWDSGLLRLPDALSILDAFLNASGHRLIGADLLGDWSPIRLSTSLNRFFDIVDHPSPEHVPAEASERNRIANEAILGVLQRGFEGVGSRRPGQGSVVRGPLKTLESRP